MSSALAYSPLDRLLHRLAFRFVGLQVSLADIEDRLFERETRGIKAVRPVFVTALPRAGTTMLLNLLVETGEFASHTYQDMPFVMCPLLWQGIAGAFQKNTAVRERAHGDGLLVGLRSPEAFEEMIWRYFWGDHYLPDRIRPWASCDDSEFLTFLTSHMRKIVALRRRENGKAFRYVSKNNGNIARVGAIARSLPDSLVLVVFREPAQHCASLLRQHISFSKMQAEDDFVREYMLGIGHYDFGAELRPIDFDGWLETSRDADRTRLEFWLNYWVAAYRYVESSVDGNRVVLLSYDRLASDPAQSLAKLANKLGLGDAAALEGQAALLRTGRTHAPDLSEVPESILEEAYALHDRLLGRSLI